MVKFLQKRAQISYEQVATGSYPTAAAAMGTARYLGHNVKHTINDTQNKMERRPCTSNNRNIKGFYLGVLDLKNTLEWEPIHFAFFANAIGQCTTTGTDPYTHVIAEENDPSLPPFNIEHSWQQATPECRIYNGCCVDKLTLRGDKGSPALKMLMDYHATYVYSDGGAVESLTESTIQPYLWHEMRIMLDTGNAGAYSSGTELKELQKAEFSVMNSLITEPRLGTSGTGRYNARPQGIERIYELVLDWDMENDDYYDLALADTEVAYQVYVYRGANDYMKLTIEDCQIVSAPDPHDAEGDLAVQSITFRGGALDATGANNTTIDSFNENAEWMVDS